MSNQERAQRATDIRNGCEADQAKLSDLKAIAFDCDGILTDCRITYSGDGQWSRSFSIRDGLGIKRLQEAGIHVAIITASHSEDIRERAKTLKIKDFYEGISDKTGAWADFTKKHGLKDHEVAYMGDDEMDLPLLEKAGFAVTVQDAMESVIEVADYVAQRPAGNGAVREICELILKARG